MESRPFRRASAARSHDHLLQHACFAAPISHPPAPAEDYKSVPCVTTRFAAGHELDNAGLLNTGVLLADSIENAASMEGYGPCAGSDGLTYGRHEAAVKGRHLGCTAAHLLPEPGAAG